MEMSSKTQKNPSIRFKGFTDAWEQRKLIEEADFFDEKRIPIDSEKRVQGRYPYYGATGVIDYVDNYIFDGEYILLAEDGANIITRNSPVAYITEGKFWLNNHAHIMKMKLGSNLFLLQLLERQNYEKFNSGTAQPKLNGQIVKNMIFNFPSYKEQNKIGNFFKLIDEAIALHQRKLSLLEQLKQTYLQVMFPQGQDSIPILRFAGHSEPWEQHKLGEISESYSGGTPSVAIQSYYGGSIPFIRSAEINSKNTELYLTEEGLNNSSAKLVDVGDILYALYGATSGEVGISQINGAINQAILAIKPKIEYDSNFIMQWLRRQKMSIISTYLQGGQGNLSGSIVKDLALYAPTKQEEQTKIGSFFKQLDDTIALHQEKIAHLKVLKSTLLNKMFI